MYSSIRNELTAKGKRPPATVDPQALMTADTFSREDFVHIARCCLAKASTVAARDVAIAMERSSIS